MRRIAIAVCLSALVAFGATTQSRAELAEVDQVGEWKLLRDSDPLFGPLGYQLALASTTDSGSSTLTLKCYFDEKNTITYGVELSSTLVNFSNMSSMAEVSSLLRYDSDEIRQADWLRTKDPSRVGFSSGGNNFLGDNDNPVFEQAVRQARQGGNSPLQRLLTINMVAAGIQMFFWNMTQHQQVALGFGSGDARKSILFNLSGGDVAVERLLGSCYEDAEASLPKDTRSAREVARWGVLETESGGLLEYLDLTSGQCLELHAVRYRRGDPLTVDAYVGSSDYVRTIADSGDIVIDGPKEKLKIYFGEAASAGRLNYRMWDRQAATCAED